MKLSVIIPVYNEANTVERLIDRVALVPVDKEIIVVDDCSTDGTREQLKKIERKYPNIQVFYSSPNRGKGHAIKIGFKLAKGDIVLVQDADMEYDPADYPNILAPYAQGKALAVYGSRFLGECRNMIFPQFFANKFFNFLTNIIHGSRLTDTCTCYKSFRSDIIKSLPLECDGFEICHEINARLLKGGCGIVEVPIRYFARRSSEGKKVKWKVFFTSTYTILKYGLAQCPAARMDNA